MAKKKENDMDEGDVVDGGDESDLREAAEKHGVDPAQIEAADEGEVSAPVEGEPQRRPSRASYRKQVVDELEKKYGERFEAQDRALSETREALAQLFGHMQATQPKASSAEPEDGLKKQLDGITAQQRDVLAAARNEKLTPEQRQELASRYEALNQEKVQALVEAKIEQRLKKQDAARAPAPENPEVKVWNQRLWREFPELMEQCEVDGDLQTQVRSHYLRLCRTKNGGRDSPALLRQAAADYTRFMQLGTPSRSRSAAWSAGGGSGGMGTGAGPEYSDVQIELMKRAGVKPEDVTRHGREVEEEQRRRGRAI